MEYQMGFASQQSFAGGGAVLVRFTFAIHTMAMLLGWLGSQLGKHKRMGVVLSSG